LKGSEGSKAPDVEQHEAVNPNGSQQRVREYENEFRSMRRELARITKEVRAAKREAERPEQIEQIKKAKRKQQEIFRIKNDLRAAKSQVEEPGTGALPDFVVIGAPKCGTTFFYNLLIKHPHVEPAACKEPNYFELLFDEGIEWYRHCFPRPRWKGGRKTVTGEATPSYLYHPHVPERMAEVIPHVRLIALLRNPVDRTYSAYFHRMRGGKEARTFEETIEASLDGPRSGHLSRAIYVDHLLHWSRYYSDEQMLVLKSEDLFGRTPEILKRVLDFLGLPDWEPDASEVLEKRNTGGYERKMDPAVRRRLTEFFEPHNQRLYDYLGVDFGW
jgi:Sulfotransferase domain